jgi:arabinogalactan oligomer / maltooligosaccharide transport system permease protein
MSSGTVTTRTAPGVMVPKPSPLARALPAFSGTVGLVLKLLLLAVANGIGLWALIALLGDESYVAAACVVAATLAIDAVYLLPIRGLIPLKFLVPGTVFLVGFQLIPIVYNGSVAFSNWSTGHNLTKEEAIQTIQETSLTQPADGAFYTMTPARDDDGNLVLLLVEEGTNAMFAGSEDGLTELAPADVTVESGAITGAEGYEVLQGSGLAGIDQELAALVVPAGGDSFVRAEGLSTALELTPTLRYDEAADTFTNIETGVVFSDNGEGSYVTPEGEEIDVGWRTSIGFANFKDVFTDPLIRDPFLSTFVWTFSYAIVTVVLTFFAGLFIAIALNHEGLRFQRLQRSILILPYAIPAFLSLLVWRGLLNDDFGVVNSLLPFDVPWLFDPFWAKVSCLLVNFWLGIPYMFLICTGSLQAIPGELTEAARVDGASGLQVFRKITLPLLLVAVAPLLIASFAFNFNNFNAIYFLTEGGPYGEDQAVAGSTDILVSYTFKVAFQTGRGGDYGLAAALSILIFFIVAVISAISFTRTKALENVA